jgi:hypothetical protein
MTLNKLAKIKWYVKESVKQKAFTHGFANNTMEVKDALKAIDEGFKNYLKENK